MPVKSIVRNCYSENEIAPSFHPAEFLAFPPGQGILLPTSLIPYKIVQTELLYSEGVKPVISLNIRLNEVFELNPHSNAIPSKV